MATDITNKVVIVTGGARGIGFAISESFLQEGAKTVIILDILEEHGNEAAAGLNTKYGANKAVFFKCDVTTDLDFVFKVIVDTYKTVDVLVNNAGVVDEKSIRRLLGINTIATVEWAMKFWEHARKDKGGNGGTIINISSMYGFIVDPFLPFYKTSKQAVLAFTRSMGHKINYEQSGVRIIAICPGFTKTALIDLAQPTENLQYQNNRWNKYLEAVPWQDIADVSKATVDVFKKADSGTAWQVIGANFVEEVPLPAEFYPDIPL